MTRGDWLTILGLAVNAGLLVGLVVQIRLATSARRTDVHRASQRATLDAWSALVESIATAEAATREHFGRGRLSTGVVEEFLEQVGAASGRISRGETTTVSKDRSVLAASESLRAVLNYAEDFAAAVSLGAYDSQTAQVVCGWRLTRVFARHQAYIERFRELAGDNDFYTQLETFAVDFLATHGVLLEDLPVLVHDAKDI